MGKHWKKKKKTGVNKVEKPKRERPQVQGYADIVRENNDFEFYYKAQKIVPDEEWQQFMSTLRTDLPSAFRLTGTKTHAKALFNIINETFFKPLSEQTKNIIIEEENASEKKCVKPFKYQCLPWYPDNLGWQLNLTRKDIRHYESYWRLHQFLISETETGNISRQEAVSMIPPLLLDVLPHHKVLDMCAAPGSKTAQILEYLHNSQSSVPEGVVVANDCDNKRCYMLTHQAKRIQSPTLIITNHDAAFMPNLLHTRKDGSVGPLKFDRILCDVPCTGDGTLRKNFDVWGKWNTVNGANLHGLQLRIARRGIEMLTVGGRMVYSTCSFNPLEDEAVINRLLAENEGCISLVDVKENLPGLKFVPGISHWTLMNRELEIISSPENIPQKNENLFHKRLFPPANEEQKHLRQLERCIRILPHHQDTGGFFVAVLQKNKPLPGEKVYCEGDQKPEPTVTEGSHNEEVAQRIKRNPKKRRRQCFKEEPFFYLAKDCDLWPPISQFYQMSDSLDSSLFLRRAEEGKGRTVYFTNALVKNIVVHNQERMKIINTGVKVLVRCDNLGSDCKFRLAQEGSQVLLPFFTGRKLKVQRNDLVHMLISDDETPSPISSMHSSTQELCETLSSGSCVFIYEDNTPDNTLHIQLVGWKGKQSVRCYVAKNDRVHYLRLLHADTSAFERNKFQEQRMLESANKENTSSLEEPQLENVPMEVDSEPICDTTKEADQSTVKSNGSEQPSIGVSDSEVKETIAS